MSLVPLIAHIGHWYMWVLYAVPVFVVAAVSIHALINQRREERARQAEEAGGS